MKNKIKVRGVIAAIILAGVYYYVTLPAINIHSAGFWTFIMTLILVLIVFYIFRKKIPLGEIKYSKPVKFMVGVLILVALVYFGGTILSSPIVNASKYQKLLTVESGEFTTDIQEVDYKQIPLLDKESASLLGNRKMGSMIDMASQFEVDEIYSQINYNDKPVRVSPLKYASVIKWLTNQSKGIPAYIMIDMATQTTELVKLDEGNKYSTS